MTCTKPWTGTAFPPIPPFLEKIVAPYAYPVIFAANLKKPSKAG